MNACAVRPQLIASLIMRPSAIDPIEHRSPGSGLPFVSRCLRRRSSAVDQFRLRRWKRSTHQNWRPARCGRGNSYPGPQTPRTQGSASSPSRRGLKYRPSFLRYSVALTRMQNLVPIGTTPEMLRTSDTRRFSRRPGSVRGLQANRLIISSLDAIALRLGRRSCNANVLSWLLFFESPTSPQVSGYINTEIREFILLVGLSCDGGGTLY